MTEEKLLQKEDLRKVIDITDEAFAKIECYHALLLKWQKAINLVSPKTIRQAWHRHFIDSAQLAPLIPQGTKIYADLGCGGGFPGLVLAMMRPELDVHLIESDERKCQFMRTVARETKTSVTIHTKRIEHFIEAGQGAITPDFVTARALASLLQLFDYCLPWAQTNPKLQFCFMKGERAQEEIAEAQGTYSFDYQITKSISSAESQILSIQNLKSV